MFQIIYKIIQYVTYNKLFLLLFCAAYDELGRGRCIVCNLLILH